MNREQIKPAAEAPDVPFMIPMNTERDVDIFHTYYRPTGEPPLACDLCGKVFHSYIPEFIGIYIPRGQEGKVITLCQDCEAYVMQLLELPCRDIFTPHNEV